MDATLSLLQQSANGAGAAEPPLPEVDRAPDPEQVARFEALMKGESGAGVAVEPAQGGSAGESALGHVVEAQDSMLSNAMSDIDAWGASSPYMSMTQNAVASMRVGSEMMMAMTHMTANVTVAQNAKSSFDTLLKNQ